MASALKKLFTAALCAALPCMEAQAAPPTEYEVKAAFIHNIAKFVEWPAARPAPGILKLCIVGRNPFGNALDALQGKQAGSLTWEIAPAIPKASLKECGVLFIAASESRDLGRILGDIEGSAVLTVGDTGGYAEQGVMVNFYQEENKVRFEINKDAAGRAGLKVSSQLLKLARIVQDTGGEK